MSAVALLRGRPVVLLAESLPRTGVQQAVGHELVELVLNFGYRDLPSDVRRKLADQAADELLIRCDRHQRNRQG